MENTKKDVMEIINGSGEVFLSTINLEGFPETRAMSNILNKNNADNKLNLYFAAHTNSPKFEQIKKNNDASLYYLIPGNMKNMTLFGKLEVVQDKSLKSKLWKEELAQYYRSGKEDELYGVLKFTPTSYKYYLYNSVGIPEKIEGQF
jgi:general stress protein 26